MQNNELTVHTDGGSRGIQLDGAGCNVHVDVVPGRNRPNERNPRPAGNDDLRVGASTVDPEQRRRGPVARVGYRARAA